MLPSLIPSKPIFKLLRWKKDRYTARGVQITVRSQGYVIGIATNLIKVIFHWGFSTYIKSKGEPEVSARTKRKETNYTLLSQNVF